MLSLCLEIKNVEKSFFSGSFRKKKRTVFSDISFGVKKGETVGITGKSGSGKTTLGKIAAGLISPDTGMVLYKGADIHIMKKEIRRQYRTRVQMLFQDPEGALNPMKTIRRQFEEVYKLAGIEGNQSVLKSVGLSEEILSRYPHELSGGQNQRIALAKILLLEPEVIILDEPTSALDISVQAQILHLLRKLQEERTLCYIFISHDPATIQFMCDYEIRLE